MHKFELQKNLRRLKLPTFPKIKSGQSFDYSQHILCNISNIRGNQINYIDEDVCTARRVSVYINCCTIQKYNRCDYWDDTRTHTNKICLSSLIIMQLSFATLTAGKTLCIAR